MKQIKELETFGKEIKFLSNSKYRKEFDAKEITFCKQRASKGKSMLDWKLSYVLNYLENKF